MAKSKSKGPIEVADANKSEKKNSNGNAITNTDSLPTFSGASLADLSKKISQKLQDSQNSKAKISSRKGPGPKTNTKPESKRDDSVSKSTASENKKGKKRDRNGQIITPQTTKRPLERKNDSTSEALEQEIYANGGTKEDFELLAGVESDSEMEVVMDGGAGAAEADNESQTLRQNIASIMKGVNVPLTSPPANSKPNAGSRLSKVPETQKKQEKEQRKEQKKERQEKQEKQEKQNNNENKKKEDIRAARKDEKGTEHVPPRAKNSTYSNLVYSLQLNVMETVC